ncbi:hypothetical protein SLEP1_g51499 [Rubroshorea leprosula]|uniref:Reverse transcriptase domain-containing protein n=1 Tax=Rubroshorea leprosula TaxID=152421 RepID=A0AAV5M714_9ROSI|nr:hypothetical protein SLEP1_g51499 [Rubroshorea leprosula]
MRERGRERERERNRRKTENTGNTDNMESEGCINQRRKPMERPRVNQSETGGTRASKEQQDAKWSYADMWRTFLKYGRVYDIYSPNRKSRSGARFGFVRFLNVHDKRELESQLDQIWVGDWKLWVNSPRFDDVKKEEKKEGEGQGLIPKYQNRSYAEVLRGYGAGNVEGANKGQYRTEPREKNENRIRESSGIAENRKVWKEKGKGASWTGMEYNIKEEEFAWLEGCYVGTVHSVEMVRNLQEKFYMEGYFYCRVRAMGGKMVLLDCEEKEELKDLVEMAVEWLAQWFNEIKPWSPELVAQERSGEEDDEVAGERGINEKNHQSQEEEVAAVSLEKFQNSNTGAGRVGRLGETQGHGEPSAPTVHREQAILAENWEKEGVETGLEKQETKRTRKGPKQSQTRSVDKESIACSSAQFVTSPIGPNRSEFSRIEETEHEISEEEDIDPFWKGFENQGVSTAGVDEQRGKNRERKRTAEMGKKVKPASNSMSGCRAARVSIGDTEIRNCNRLAERQRQEQQPTNLWDFAKKLGVVAVDEQQIVKRIEEMEKRDKEEKASMMQLEEASSKKNTGLIDLPLVGRRFTWYNSNGKYMSRIDRFLLTEEWILKWGDMKQWGLNRTVSDHCPILLKNEKMDWGPKPFKFFDAWLDQPGCKEFIRKVWKSTTVRGWKGYKLKEKLKRTKKELKEWSRNSIPEVDSKIMEAEKEIATIDEKGEIWDANTKYFHRSAKGRWRRNEILCIRINGVQHTGVAEIKNEVATYFEELFTEEKWERPKLDGIDFKRISEADNDILTAVFSEKEVKEAVWECESSKSPGPDGFNFKFVKVMWEDIKSDVVEFVQEFHEQGKIAKGSNASFIVLIPKVENPQKIEEYRPISLIDVMYKILAKIFANRLRMVIDKVIGEHQMAFIRGRQLAKGAVIANEEFHEQGKIAKGSNASFIVLIPKVENPQKIEEYRPISLIGVMYKILAKILANRLRMVIDKVIGEHQMAFIRGRQLAEGAVIANEVIDEVKRKKKKSFIFKVDFEKAYDKVCWGFIEYMMLRMGFCEKWRGWIKECLRSSSVSVMINGSPTREFRVSKGIRQGDPLSPFLFLIVAEGLNGMVTAASEKQLYKGVKVGTDDIMVSHLQFADDTIFFGEATDENIWAIKCIVRSFELVSGLKVNYAKSQLMGVNVEEAWVEKMAYRLYCKRKDLPFKYLGIPIGGNHRRIAMWHNLMESVKKKLAPWKGRYLSFGGRITIVNSVLSSLPVFLMSVYLLPKGIIHFIDKIRKSFLWGGEGEGRKINWVKWEKVCKNKLCGGLGVREMRKFNLALMGKWWGRLARNEQGLWDKIIASKYGGSGGHWLDWVRDGRGIGSLWWRDVGCLNNVDEEKEGWLTEGFKLKLGEGKGVSFWRDNWGGEGDLANLYPRLYNLSTGKEKKCCQMGNEEDGIWRWNLEWRRALFDWEREEAAELQQKIDSMRIHKDIPDTWKWDGLILSRWMYW